RDPIAVHVERLLLRGQRERRDDRDAPRADELREQGKVHRLDLTGVVVAKKDGLPTLHRAHVLLARDEETTGYSGEPDRVDAALLKLLDVEEVLHAQSGHREDLERSAIRASTLVTRGRNDRLLGMTERCGELVRFGGGAMDENDLVRACDVGDKVGDRVAIDARAPPSLHHSAERHGLFVTVTVQSASESAVSRMVRQ